MVDRQLHADEDICDPPADDADGSDACGREADGRPRLSNLSRKGVLKRLIGGVIVLLATLAGSAALIAAEVRPIEWRLALVVPMLAAAICIVQAVEKT